MNITDDSYYTCSKGALRKLGWKIGLKAYNFDQFDLQFNRPDLVVKSLPNADSSLIPLYYKAYQKRLKKLNFTENMFTSDWQVPEVLIAHKESIPLVINDKSLVIGINALDTKFTLDRINIWVNSVPVCGINGIDLRDLKIQQVSKKLQISLSRGVNKIEVSVMNDKGAESLKETVVVNYEPKLDPAASPDLPASELYIVTIGASEYKNPKFNLTYAAKDATDLATLFSNQKNKFKNVYTINIINNNVIKEKIANVKQTLLQSNVDDEVIVFYAGHGLLDDNLDYYLATYDIEFKKPAERGLIYEELENLLDSIPARKKLLMIDACHSGEVDKDEELTVSRTNSDVQNIVFRGDTALRSFMPSTNISYKNSFELMKELFADLRRGTGAVVISSAGGGEYAYEGEQWKNGVFTYCIINGLTSGAADLNNDGEIFVSELRQYVFENVSKLTGGKQNPTSRSENLEFDFRVW